MTQTPLISFIIPFFNNGETIDETIQSIYSQSYNNYDIWLVNDGSTDQLSLEKLKELALKPKINILHQENAGPSIARNLAISKSSAQFIVPLDADDLIEKDTIEIALPYFKDNNMLAAVYGDLQFFEQKNEIKIQEEFNIKKQFIWNQVAECAVIKKEIYTKLGGYDEYLSKPGLEDWEFWLRVGASEYKLLHVNKVCFKIRVNHDSRTFEVANRNLDLIKEYVYKKHAVILSKNYTDSYYNYKMLKETPDYRIGNFFLKPYRWVKSIFN